MILEKFKKKGIVWVKAVDNKTLFKHCAEGCNEVTMSKYTATVEFLLINHGVRTIKFKEQSK